MAGIARDPEAPVRITVPDMAVWDSMLELTLTLTNIREGDDREQGTTAAGGDKATVQMVLAQAVPLSGHLVMICFI